MCASRDADRWYCPGKDNGEDDWQLSGSYLSAESPDPPLSCDIVELEGDAPSSGVVHTVTFSPPVASPLTAFMRIGAPSGARDQQLAFTPA